MGSHPNRKRFDWNRKDIEVWVFNESPNQKENGKLVFPHSEVSFQLHTEAIWRNPANRTDPTYPQWLKENKNTKVYMQDKYKDVPMSEKYPLKEVYNLTDNLKVKGDNFKYFSSSPDFAFALIAKMFKEGKKYQKVEVWGIELAMETEYQYQRTGFGFWIGYLTALGIDIDLHTDIFDAPMYGYEGDIAISSKIFDQREIQLKRSLVGASKFDEESKQLFTKLDGFQVKDISKEFIKEMNELVLKGEPISRTNGMIKENQRYKEKAQIMERETGEAVFSIGEFDGVSLDYQKHSIQVTNEAIQILKDMDDTLKRLIKLKKRSQKRLRAINLFGKKVLELINKNLLLAHLKGGLEENRYYIDSSKLSIKLR